MLKISNLSAGYGSVEVLHGIDIEVGTGELVAVVGSNGAGKTTLLRTVSGLTKATGGAITFDGQDILSLAPNEIVRAGIVHVPEGRMVLAKMTVLENLRLGAYVRTDHKAIEADLEAVVAMFPWLSERLGQLAGTLSGGEQQMLAIGRGLMSRPRVLLLDEPSLGVAPIFVNEIFRAIDEVKKRGVTIVLVEQNASRALAAANRGYALEFGSVFVSGEGKALLNDDRIRRAYLGI